MDVGAGGWSRGWVSEDPAPLAGVRWFPYPVQVIGYTGAGGGQVFKNGYLYPRSP